MTPFTQLHAVAVPMPDADIDTDIIFPARFLLLTEKTGLGRYAFYEKRFNADGSPREPGFVLDQPACQGAQILVTGANFGCGSSREQAPWALADLGIRCLIAPSFGEIFQSNCYKNGLLPIVMPAAAVDRLIGWAGQGAALTVDLQRCCVQSPDGELFGFDIPPWRREALLQGQDEIDFIQAQHGAQITAFEAMQRRRKPWLYTPIHIQPATS